ncbi:LysR substrate-binding domain-containing protein [Pseudovibrio sp. Ad26]|uniref:LysR substrate-binding domain-containing protein n=1 Tax=Pseudovibrio sp. Ad26 TaxID=989410 RepID=UPI0007AE8730|nr:LysR substrate-binding domain-containing protein [Pseudovibrio sp. Ad26]KZK97226.1 Glycine cleavage system transcriptional activator [Pseudovibrio sp. Ad26]
MAEEGEATFLNARRRIEGIDRTETGSIRFSLPPMMAFDVVAPILARFSEAYPGIDVEVRLTDEQEDINRAETDVSLHVAYEVSDDVVAQKLYPIAIGTYASQYYIDNALPKAGAGLNWIGLIGARENPGWLSQSPFPAASVRHASSEGYMHISLLRQGCGTSQLPVIFEHLFPDLSQIPGTPCELDRTMWILLQSDLRRTVRVCRFVDFQTKGLRELQPLLQGQLHKA